MQTINADELTRRLKNPVAEAWREVCTATGGRPLALDPVNGAPMKLAKAIDRHNATAAELAARPGELADAADILVGLVDAADVTEEGIGEAVDKFRGFQLRLLLDYRRLVLARRPLLEQTAEALRVPLADAEGALAKAREEGRSKLMDAGFVPGPARGYPGVAPESEKRVLELQVDQLAPVRKVVDVVGNIRARLSATTDYAAAAERDADALAKMIAGEVARMVLLSA